MKGKALVVLLLSVVVFSIAQHVSGQNENGTKYVIFRDDDITSNYNLKTLKAVNQVHVDKSVPVTLGIVPHPYLNQHDNELYMDHALLQYMTSISSNPLFEFAQHGYTHHDVTGTLNPSEFYGVRYGFQYNTIKQGQSDIEKAFGIKPTTFIPPFDRADINTLKALKSLGFTDYSTAFSDFNVYKGYREGIQIDSVSLILDDATLQFAKNETDRLFSEKHGSNTIIVFYHFATFSGPGEVLNESKVRLLEDYIDYLKQRGDVTFTKLDRSYSVESKTSGRLNPDTTSYANNTSEKSDPFAIGNQKKWPLVTFAIPTYAIFFFGGLIVFNRLNKKNVKRKF
jgi:peptidoglycan/xylan/chitin deacetylase (PgdA/CDA1 family)